MTMNFSLNVMSNDDSTVAIGASKRPLATIFGILGDELHLMLYVEPLIEFCLSRFQE